MPFSRHVLATLLLILGSLASNLAGANGTCPSVGLRPCAVHKQSATRLPTGFQPILCATGAGFRPVLPGDRWDLLCQQNYECCMQEDEQLFLGCMNPVACNYDPMACVDVPTSCLFCLESCVSVFVMGNALTQWALEDGDNVVASGAFDSGNPSGLQAACVNDGCYTLTIDSEDLITPFHGAFGGPKRTTDR